MTEPDRRGRGVPSGILKAVAVVAVIGLGVWLVPLGSDEGPTVTTAGSLQPSTTRPEPPERRFSPGELDDVLPLPDGVYATAAAWDGARFWVIVADAPQPPQSPPPMEGLVLSIDPENGEVLTETELDRSPWVIVADSDGVWVLHQETGELTHLDPSSGDELSTLQFPVPIDDAERPPPRDLALIPGSAWILYDDGALLRVSTAAEEFQEVALLPTEQAGSLVTEFGEVWVLPRGNEKVLTRIDPVDLSSLTVDLDEVAHPITTAALVGGELFVAGDAENGAVVSRLDSASLTADESYDVPSSVAMLGWVGGSFGILDANGVFSRLLAAGGADRLITSWDGEATLFPVESETWMLADDGASLARVLITGSEN